MAQARLQAAMNTQPQNANAIAQAQAMVAAFTNTLTRANATIEQRNAAYDAAAAYTASAAYDAAVAAARIKTKAEVLAIVRRHYPTMPERNAS
jgi:predicted nucleic acid-binding protein